MMSQAGRSIPAKPPMTPSAQPSDRVFIMVQGRTFRLKYDVLASSNEFSQFNMSTEEFLKRDHPRALAMDNEDPLVISLFVTFLRKKTIDLSLIEEDPYVILFNAYRLAKSWNDDRFQDAVVDAFALCVSKKVPWDWTLPKYVWEVEPAESPLRRLFLDTYVWMGDVAKLTVETRDGLTGDFIMDLAKHSISTVRSLATAETSPFVTIGCRYHAHKEDESCGHTKHDQITTVDQDQHMTDATVSEAAAETIEETVTKEVPQTVENAAALVFNDAHSDKKEEVAMKDTEIVPHEGPTKNTQGSDPDTAGQDVNEEGKADGAQRNALALNPHSRPHSAEAVLRAPSASSSITVEAESRGPLCDTTGHSENEQDITNDEQAIQATITNAAVRSAFTEPSEHPVPRMCSMGPLLLTNRSSTPMPLRAKTPLVRSATEPIGARVAGQIPKAVEQEQLAHSNPRHEAKEALEEPVVQQEIRHEEKTTPTKRSRDDDDIEEIWRHKKSPKKNGKISSEASKTPVTPTKATSTNQRTPKKRAAQREEKKIHNTYSETISLD